MRKLISKIIDEQYIQWEKAKNIPSIPITFNRNILKKYENYIEKILKDIFEKLPLSNSDKNKLKMISSDLFSKFPEGIQKRGPQVL